jgi:hypothetical protein
MDKLILFASGNYSLHQALGEPRSEELTVEGEDFTAARVVANGGEVARFYTDRFKHYSNTTYLSWLCSNLMLEHSLNLNPKFICPAVGITSSGNIQIKPVEYFGAALATLPNGLRTTMTLMSRAPGQRVLDLCLEREGIGTGLNTFFGLPEEVFLDGVAASFIESLRITYPEFTYLRMVTDPHHRNIIIDENLRAISAIDVNGVADQLGPFLGEGSIADLEVDETS